MVDPVAEAWGLQRLERLGKDVRPASSAESGASGQNHRK
jgi:hypothetical protein